jgi:hypothetical protein
MSLPNARGPAPALPFLPPTLPLIPLPAPLVLFPFLSVNIALSEDELALVLRGVADNVRAAVRFGGGDRDRSGGEGRDGRERTSERGAAADSKLILGSGTGERIVGVVPVVEIERRVGRWATGESGQSDACQG